MKDVGIDLKDGIFFSTKHFTVGTWKEPEICRTDGGHIVICPKKEVVHRWNFSTEKAKELMLLSMVVGEAMLKGMNNRGIPVERLNIHDDGNYAIGTKKGPRFHLHIYGRAKNSVHQKRGESLYFPDRKTKFWKKMEPLNLGDVEEIVKQMKKILKRKKYSEIGRYL